MIRERGRMSTVAVKPFFHFCLRQPPSKLRLHPCKANSSSLNFAACRRPLSPRCLTFSNSKPPSLPLSVLANAFDVAVAETATSESTDLFFRETFPLKLTEKVEGKISIRLNTGKDEGIWKLTVGCNLAGNWVLHWGVNYVDDVGSEWDQPPVEMRPPGSIAIKDYAIETPLSCSSTAVDGEVFHEVTINFNTKSSIAAINFVLKDEDTGSWYQHRGRDFKVPLIYLDEDENTIGARKIFGLPVFFMEGTLGQLSNMILNPKDQDSSDLRESSQQKRHLEGFYVEHSLVKETFVDNSICVSVEKCSETGKNVLHVETDLPGEVIVHWGVCKDESRNWEIPSKPYPIQTTLFKNKALRTLLQQKEDGHGSFGSFSLDEGYVGFLFVLKMDGDTWLNCVGNDFYIPLPISSEPCTQPMDIQCKTLDGKEVNVDSKSNQAAYSVNDEIINDIRSLTNDISSEKSQAKSIEAQESILREIEKLAAEAYKIFRSSASPVLESIVEFEAKKTTVTVSSGTGSGFEVLCQGFNWESHKSGRWYLELYEKAAELASLGFTIIWLPPPTESVSPEGYMPKDLYNLNSRYGNIDELKVLVKRFHEVGIKVLGDVVLNHRCAHSQNQNGVWNIFGGRLNWDDRAVVGDDTHFQGRGNKSSGDNFHAAPNIDHSQEFVRKDIKEWLRWLREEIGYDGWRLDFVRGFWGGYVHDYLTASEPYFAVGEFWDSLNYIFGEMDSNQDAHRQRIVDWINATKGFAGAFDVTTKGILHSAIERCEYWRLSDKKGKPPGVVGWWPSRAVTFIENHDTGSTQGHWRFPSGNEMQGYAYILTHPGTPSVFYDHIFSHYYPEIAALISIRNRNKLHCRSAIKITKAERDVYAAIIDDNVAMKIGPGHYEPSAGAKNWSLAIEGRNYKVWETS